MSTLTKFDSSIESFLGPLAPIYSNLVEFAGQNDEKFKEERVQQMLEWLFIETPIETIISVPPIKFLSILCLVCP